MSIKKLLVLAGSSATVGTSKRCTSVATKLIDGTGKKDSVYMF